FLGLLHDQSVLDDLIEVSGDPDAYVRSRVAFALGQLGDPRALHTLYRLAHDEEKVVRYTANEALAKITRKQRNQTKGRQKQGSSLLSKIIYGRKGVAH